MPEMIRMGGNGTDGNGYYRLEGLAPGKISVEATHEDYPRVVKDLEAREGINRLDLHVRGRAEVEGRVQLDRPANPWPGPRCGSLPRAGTGAGRRP